MVKFYRSLGFDGYKEFKLALAKELPSQTFYHTSSDITFNDNISEIINKVLSGAVDTITMNLCFGDGVFKSFENAAQLLSNAKRIIFIGYAASAALCYYAYFRFIELGYDCHFSPDGHINAAVLSRAKPDDLIFCVSQSGETSDIIRLLNNKSDSNVKVLLITGKEDSTLAKMSDVTITIQSQENNILTDAMNSRVAQFCTIDVLFSIVGISNGEDAISSLISTRETFIDYKNRT